MAVLVRGYSREEVDAKFGKLQLQALFAAVGLALFGFAVGVSVGSQSGVDAGAAEVVAEYRARLENLEQLLVNLPQTQSHCSAGVAAPATTSQSQSDRSALVTPPAKSFGVEFHAQAERLIRDGWLLLINVASDLGPAASLYDYSTPGVGADAAGRNFGLGMAGVGLSANSIFRLQCRNSAVDALQSFFVRGVADARNAFRAAGRMNNVTSLECSYTEDFAVKMTGKACLVLDDDTHTYWGFDADRKKKGYQGMRWALYGKTSGRGPHTLRHCAQKHGGKHKAGQIWVKV